MNAYELADALQETEPYYSTDYKLFDNAANMLRQQADELNKVVQKLVKANGLIENLKIRIAELEKELEKTSKAAMQFNELLKNDY